MIKKKILCIIPARGGSNAEDSAQKKQQKVSISKLNMQMAIIHTPTTGYQNQAFVLTPAEHV